MASSILAPVVALVLWTLAVQAWLYATRIPAMVRQKIVYDPQKPNQAFQAQFPARVRWKADNYNNLMEQPTLFYAIALTLALSGAGEGGNALLAWLYVAVRIAHSLWHATVNTVLVRFGLFIAGSLVLLVLTLRAAMVLFG